MKFTNQVIMPRIYGLSNLILSRIINLDRSGEDSEISFLFFYSRGRDFDKGFDLSDTASKVESQLSSYFKKILPHNKQSLKLLPGSEEYCNEQSTRMPQNPNAHSFGYFDFKTFLINAELQKLAKNEILFYHDGNFVKNPQYWETDWLNINKLLNFLLKSNKSSVWFQFERGGTKVREYVGEFALDYFFSENEKRIVKRSHLINAARIVVKNDDIGRKFINEYLFYCSIKQLMSPSTNTSSDAKFKWSCGDQDILNCLVYRWIIDGKLSILFPRYSFYYRVLRVENRTFNWLINSQKLPHRTGIYMVFNIELYVFVYSLRFFDKLRQMSRSFLIRIYN